jgi:hypothetical protein
VVIFSITAVIILLVLLSPCDGIPTEYGGY